ncbi:MAG: hypothetical protein JXR86_16995, partial [Spirochaetales bacterium]|nr:hypothetical protein [Spirochaetales bacterium]
MQSCSQLITPLTPDVLLIVEDEIKPVIVIETPRNNSTYRSYIVVSGTVSDSVLEEDDGIGEIVTFEYGIVDSSPRTRTVTVDGSGSFSISPEDPDAAFSYNPETGDFAFVISTTVPNVLSSVQTVYVEVTDSNGNTSRKEVNLQSYLYGPYISIVSPDPENPGTYSSTVTVTGFVTNSMDDSSTSEVDTSSLQYKIRNFSDFINLSEDEYDSDTGAFSITFDTTGSDPAIARVEGDLIFQLIAYDKNDYSTIASLPIYSDGAGPFISVTSPDPENPGTYNSIVTVTGTIFNSRTDDESTSEVDPLSLEYRVEASEYIPISEDDESFTYDTLTGIFHLSFSTTGENPAIPVVDGDLDLRIRAKDLNDNLSLFYLVIESDNTGPSLSIITPQDGSYYASTVTLSGYVEDFAGSRSVDECGALFYQLPGQDRVEMDYDNQGYFEDVLDFSGINDPKALKVLAYDKNGEISEVVLDLYNDYTGPYIAITDPSVSDRQFRSSVTVSGSVSNDSSGLSVSEVDRLEWLVAGTSLSGVFSNTNSEAETDNFDGGFTFTFSPYDAGYAGTSLTVVINAFDKNGNKTSENILMTKYDQGMFLDITAPQDQAKYADYDYKFTLRGSVRDRADASAFDELKSLVCTVSCKRDGSDQLIPVDLLTDSNLGNPGLELVDWDEVNGDFSYFYSIPNSATTSPVMIRVTATDLMNVTSTHELTLISSTEGPKINFTQPVLFNYTISSYDESILYYSYDVAKSEPYVITISGNIPDAGSIQYFSYQTKIGSTFSTPEYLNLPEFDSSSGDFSFDVDINSLANANSANDMYINLEAKDVRNKTSNPIFIFENDSVKPAVVVSDDDNNGYVKNGDTVQFITVITEENSGLSGIPQIRIGGVNYGDMTPSGNNWEFLWNVPDGDNASASIEIIVSDKVGNESEIPTGRNVYVIDNTYPTVDTITPDTYISDTSGATFNVVIDFSEAMGSTVPTIVFADNIVGSILSLNGSSGWTDSDTYTFVYDVTNTDNVISDIDITISGAKDLAGNTSGSLTNTDGFDVDFV